jgi:hypothetical protein
MAAHGSLVRKHCHGGYSLCSVQLRLFVFLAVVSHQQIGTGKRSLLGVYKSISGFSTHAFFFMAGVIPKMVE